MGMSSRRQDADSKLKEVYNQCIKDTSAANTLKTKKQSGGNKLVWTLLEEFVAKPEKQTPEKISQHTFLRANHGRFNITPSVQLPEVPSKPHTRVKHDFDHTSPARDIGFYSSGRKTRLRSGSVLSPTLWDRPSKSTLPSYKSSEDSKVDKRSNSDDKGTETISKERCSAATMTLSASFVTTPTQCDIKCPTCAERERTEENSEFLEFVRRETLRYEKFCGLQIFT